MKNFLLIFAIIVLIGAGIIVWASVINKKAPSQAKTTQHMLPKESTVTLDANGFSPAALTVKVGTAVRWKNMSGEKQTVNSDDYPTNRLHKELNFGIFNNGSSVVYTFAKEGTYGYHNQFHPEQKGKVIVEK